MMCKNNSVPLEQIIQTLMQQLEDQGYSSSALAKNRRISAVMRSFLAENDLTDYSKDTGSAFVDFCKGHDESAEVKKYAALFVQRLDSILDGKDIPAVFMKGETIILPDGLETLLDNYRADCEGRGLKDSTIRINLQQARRFLHYVSISSCGSADQMDSKAVGDAVLSMGRACYIPRIKTFLRFLFGSGHTDKDFSYIVPGYRIPQPVPSVYSEAEVAKIEEAVLDGNPQGRRDHAVLLLASRLGLRSGDIAALTFDSLDYSADIIRITQQKTGAILELPMLPEIKEAIILYVNDGRPVSSSPYVFLTPRAPYRHISAKAVGKRIARALGKTDIDTGGRRRGAHSLRASLASSMVNDGIPYEAVRQTLGHSDLNSTRCYARLDVGQLRPYTLSPPEASGVFQKFLEGRGRAE